MRIFHFFLLILFFLLIPKTVFAVTGYISDIQYSKSDKIYTLSESPEVTVYITNPSGGDSYTAKLVISNIGPDGTNYGTETNEFQFNPGNIYYATFDLYDTLKSGVGFYSTELKLQKKSCILFVICWWDDVNTKIVDNFNALNEKYAYGVIFNRPTGFDNYLSDDTYHHPSDIFIKSYALLAVTKTETESVLNYYRAMDALKTWLFNYIRYCGGPGIDDCTDKCDGGANYCGGAARTDYWIIYDKKGVCSAYANLYESLARTLNIPTRIVLAMQWSLDEPRYQQYDDYSLPLHSLDPFWYHAFAESFDNGWTHVDPTWNEINNPGVYLKNSPNNHLIARAWTEDFSNWDGYNSCLQKYGNYCSEYDAAYGWTDVTRERPYDSNWKLPELYLVSSIPKKVLVGKTYNFQNWLNNKGDITSYGVNLTISYSSGLELQTGEDNKKIDKIYSQKYNYSTWTFYVNENGTQTVTITAESSNAPVISNQYFINSEYPVNFTPQNISTSVFLEKNIMNGKSAILTAIIQNPGDIRADCVSASLTLPNGLVLTSGENATKMTTIDPQTYSEITWSINASQPGDYRDKITVEVYMDSKCNNGFENYENIKTGLIVHSGYLDVTIPKINYKPDEEVKISIKVINDNTIPENYSVYSSVYSIKTLKWMVGKFESIDNLSPGSNHYIDFTFIPTIDWTPEDYTILTRLYSSDFWGIYSTDYKNITILPNLKLNVSANIPEQGVKDYGFPVDLNIENIGNAEIKCISGEIYLPDGLRLPTYEQKTKTADISASYSQTLHWWVYADEAGIYEDKIMLKVTVDSSCNPVPVDDITITKGITIKSGYINITMLNTTFKQYNTIDLNAKITNDGPIENDYLLATILRNYQTDELFFVDEKNVTNINPGDFRVENIKIKLNSSFSPADYALYVALYDVNYLYGFYGYDYKNITILESTPPRISIINPIYWSTQPANILLNVSINKNGTCKYSLDSGVYSDFPFVEWFDATHRITLDDYPKPFCDEGYCNFYIVFGEKGTPGDIVAGTDITARLAAENYIGIPIDTRLDTLKNRILLGEAINNVRYSLTSADFPILLASGEVVDNNGNTYGYTQDIILDDSARVTFGTSGGDLKDPVVYISLPTTVSNSNYIYTARVTFSKLLNISSTSVIGSTINLFGNEWTIGSGSEYSTSTKKLILHYNSQKLTLEDGQEVLLGTDNYIENTLVQLTGVAGWGLSKIEVFVSAQDSNHDDIQVGKSYIDPVWNAFKLKFTNTTPGLDDPNSDSIFMTYNGDRAMTLKFTDYSNNENTIEFAYNNVSSLTSAPTPYLMDSNQYKIVIKEGDPVYYKDYVIINQEVETHLLQLTNIPTGQVKSTDTVSFKDVMSGSIYEKTISPINDCGNTYCNVSMQIGSQTYYVAVYNQTTKQAGYVRVTWDSPTTSPGDTGATFGVPGKITVFPGIKAKNGEYIYFVNNYLTFRCGDSVILPKTGDTSSSFDVNCALSGKGIYTFTKGAFSYNLWNSSNIAHIQMTKLNISKVGVAILEETQSDGSKQDVVYLPVTDVGIITRKLAVGMPIFSDITLGLASFITLGSNSYVSKAYDVYGTLVTYDSTGDQGKVTITYPDNQLYADIFILTNKTKEIIKKAVPISESISKLDTDITDPGTINRHLILIGTPCSNSLIEKLAERGYIDTCDNWSLKPGEGMIVLIPNAFTLGQYALIVSGDPSDTISSHFFTVRNAGAVLQKFDNPVIAKKFNGNTAVIVTGVYFDGVTRSDTLSEVLQFSQLINHLSEGTHKLDIKCKDNSDNEAIKSISFAVDSCIPNWVLNDTWSECLSSGIQYKNYYDINNCNEPESQPQSINQTCNYVSYQGIINTIANQTTKIDAKDKSNTTLELVTRSDLIDASINLTEQFNNPGTANVGVLGLNKYIEIEADENIKNNLGWIIIKMYYTDEDVSNAGIDESTLRMYYYNETISKWEVMTNSGVNTTANYVWGNTTHLSFFGLFGNLSTTTTTIPTTTVPPTATVTGGGGGGGGGIITTTTLFVTTTIPSLTTTVTKPVTTTTVSKAEAGIPTGKTAMPTGMFVMTSQNMMIIVITCLIIVGILVFKFKILKKKY
jgi:transglutaminase-like putative cysteine protease